MNTIEDLGEEQAFAKIVDRSITSFEDDQVSTIGVYAFYNCSKLTTVNFPAATSIGTNAFYNCTNLTTANFSAATSIGQQAFYSCSKLTTANFPAATRIGGYAFYRCSKLTTLILGANQVATLDATNAFSGAGNCIIYVPDDLVDSYKAATNWSTYASRIKGISELPE